MRDSLSQRRRRPSRLGARLGHPLRRTSHRRHLSHLLIMLSNSSTQHLAFSSARSSCCLRLPSDCECCVLLGAKQAMHVADFLFVFAATTTTVSSLLSRQYTLQSHPGRTNSYIQAQKKWKCTHSLFVFVFAHAKQHSSWAEMSKQLSWAKTQLDARQQQKQQQITRFSRLIFTFVFSQMALVECIIISNNNN